MKLEWIDGMEIKYYCRVYLLYKMRPYSFHLLSMSSSKALSHRSSNQLSVEALLALK